jgi:predicted GNAT family acetyltransferase
MVLVPSRFEGMGLGRALMEHALNVAGEDTAVSLFGTDSGRALYDKLGFQPVRRSVAFRGHFRVDPQANSGKKRARRATARPDCPGTFALPPKPTLRILTRMPGFADRILLPCWARLRAARDRARGRHDPW